MFFCCFFNYNQKIHILFHVLLYFSKENKDNYEIKKIPKEHKKKLQKL